ncbi:transaldolase [Maridesulfovibrio ferrireducens]|uniref:Transaldolase n=1 Tax=Maridesulfovibrio ferrireducens TaxID=246191 RepID=A0A1G9I579_9BACT|nr:transaldolase family protein [Maridesulfovibrio ferrireducens]SDL19953.1 transaldolase [Maridesulfovibrio ferrireducens]
MKIFLDSTSIDEVKKAIDYKLIDGVHFGSDFSTIKDMNLNEDVMEILKIVHGPVVIKTSELNSQCILDDAKCIIGFGPNAVVEIPTTLEGLKAAGILSERDIPVSMVSRLISVQAVMAARLGGDFVNLKLHETEQEEGASESLDSIVSIFKNYDFKSKIIASGLTEVKQVSEALRIGVDIISVSYELLIKLV